MHDILEGVAVVEIRCMLQVLIQDLRLFSLAMLNNRIQKFPYGTQDAANRPLSLPDHTISSGGSETLKQSGGCMANYICMCTCMYA